MTRFLISDNNYLSRLLTEQGIEHTVISDSLVESSFPIDTILIYDSVAHGFNPLLAELSSIRTVILGEINNSSFIQQLLETGIRAYLFIDDFLDEINVAIATLQNNETYKTTKIESHEI